MKRLASPAAVIVPVLDRFAGPSAAYIQPPSRRWRSSQVRLIFSHARPEISTRPLVAASQMASSANWLQELSPRRSAPV
jgi:hypothetical protein